MLQSRRTNDAGTAPGIGRASGRETNLQDIETIIYGEIRNKTLVTNRNVDEVSEACGKVETDPPFHDPAFHESPKNA
jgi:hypothetical protein